MAAFIEPLRQSHARVGHVDAGDAHRLETEFAPPRLDIGGEPGEFGTRCLIHSSHHNDHALRLHLPDAAATARLGERLAHALVPGLHIYLSGPLGSGKTTLVRGLLGALGVTGRVKSPSYALVELYTVSRLDLYHFDFFRFTKPAEWSEAGFREYFGGSAVCVVEWPEKAEGQLPVPDVEIALANAGPGREARLVAHTDTGQRCLNAASVLKSHDGSS